MQRVPNPSMFRLLGELSKGVTVYDPKGRPGFTTGRKESDLKYGILLHSYNQTVYYDVDEVVEVKNYNIPKPL